MQGGFSFDGVDIALLGLEYVPDNANTYVYQPAPYTTHEETFDGHDGGYYYGATVRPKDFNLRCIFQEEHINDGIMTRIHSLFSKGRTGKLVFQKRPWCWYLATVVAPTEITQMTNYMNGIVTIRLRAYYPFARSDEYYVNPSAEYAANMRSNSAMIWGSAANGITYTYALADGTTRSAPLSLKVYNGGTEPAKLSVEIAGDAGDGVNISNSTTQQHCRFVGLNNGNTTSVGKYLLLDGMSGKTTLVDDNGDEEFAYLYHDEGFIDIAPGLIVPSLHVTAAANSRQFTLVWSDEYPEGLLDISEYAGKYILFRDSGYIGCIDGTSSGNTIVLRNGETAPAAAYDGEAMIVQVNDISVNPVSSMTLTRLKLNWQPTFA